jgi:hypothetical protein
MGLRGRDTFTRANAATLGTAEVGPAWEHDRTGGVANLGISGNKVHSPGDGSNTTYVAVQDGGAPPKLASPFVMQLTVDTLEEIDGAGAGIVFRYSDVSNFWRWLIARPSLSIVYLQKQVAGSYTTVQAVSQAVASGDVIRVVDDGASVLAYHNGALKYTANDAQLGTAQKAGMLVVQGVGGAAVNWRLDNWSFVTEQGRYGVTY